MASCTSAGLCRSKALWRFSVTLLFAASLSLAASDDVRSHTRFEREAWSSGDDSTSRRSLLQGGVRRLIYSEVVCGGSLNDAPGDAPTLEDQLLGGVSNFEALGAVTGIRLGWAEAYVNTTTGVFYPHGIYAIDLFYGDYPAPPGTLHPVVPRNATREGNALTSLPPTEASLTYESEGPLDEGGQVGSLLSALVCCSADNMLDSVRLVRQLQGDVKLGFPVCNGYAVSVTRPPGAPLWAGLRVGVQRPPGSRSEYVVASLQFIWGTASLFPAPSPPSNALPPPSPSVALPPPRPPPSPLAALPPPRPPPSPTSVLSPPPSPPAATTPPPTPDWVSITQGVVNFELDQPVTPIVMTRRVFPVANTPDNLTVIAATRYAKGAATALGSENMLEICCGGPRARRYARGEALQGLDLLVVQAASWSAAYWAKTGSVKVRVSHERYIPFAEWLVARLGPPFLAPRQYGGTGWVASVDLFVRSVRGTLGEGKPRPAMELMILGPEDPKYDDPVTPKAVQDFLAAGGGVMFLGPNPLPRDPSEGASSPSSPPPQPALRPPPARKPKKARKPKARATAATTTVSAPSQFVLTPSSPMATFTVLGGGTGRRLLQRFNASFQLNKVSGPIGINYMPPDAPTASAGSVSVATQPSSALHNAELAAGAYVQALQGSPPQGFSLQIVTSTIAQAQAVLPRGAPGTEGLYTLVDAIQRLGGTIPRLSPPPPPSRGLASPPPPARRPPPPPAGGGGNTGPYTLLGCFVDQPAPNRALPTQLAQQRLNTVDKCAALARASPGATVFGLQGQLCMAGTDAARAVQYGRAADAECSVRCGGNRTQACGSAAAGRLRLSLYQLSSAGAG